jgi:hypothetical protein
MICTIFSKSVTPFAMLHQMAIPILRHLPSFHRLFLRNNILKAEVIVQQRWVAVCFILHPPENGQCF